MKTGTKKFCPNCNSVQSCEANQAVLNELEGHRFQRLEDSDQGIHWFQRGIICNNCKETFVTVEITKDILDELIELRKKSHFLAMCKTALAIEGTAEAHMNSVAEIVKDIRNGTFE